MPAKAVQLSWRPWVLGAAICLLTPEARALPHGHAPAENSGSLQATRPAQPTIASGASSEASLEDISRNASELENTTTSSEALDANSLDALGEAPLTREDLLLLESLDGASTSTPAPSLLWTAPSAAMRARTITQARLTEPVARGLAEAFASMPVLAGNHRLGLERTVFVDGMRVETPLRQGLAREWLGIDPRFFAAAVLTPHADLRLLANTRGGTLELFGLAPPSGPAETLAASIDLRSADRSSGLWLFGALGGELAGLCVSIGYDDRRATRLALDEGQGELPTTSQRWTASARGRLLGRPGELARLSLGLDLDRLQGLRLDAETRQALSQRALAFIRLDLGDERNGAFLLAGYQDERQRLEYPNSESLGKAQHLQLRGAGQLALAEPLVLRVGGHLGLGMQQGRFDAPNARARRLEAFAALELTTARIEGFVTARLLHRQLYPLPGANPHAVPLLQASARIQLLGPLGFRAAASRGAEREFSGLRDKLTVELGPSLRGTRGWLEVSGLLRALRDEGRRAFGLEIEGAWSIVSGLHLGGVASWAEEVDDSSASPHADGLLTLRLELPLPGAFVQAHVRAVSGPWHLFGAETSSAPVHRRGFSAGLLAAATLAPGLSFNLAIENLLDQPAETAWDHAPAAGLDMRALVTWRHP